MGEVGVVEGDHGVGTGEGRLEGRVVWHLEGRMEDIGWRMEDVGWKTLDGGHRMEDIGWRT